MSKQNLIHHTPIRDKILLVLQLSNTSLKPQAIHLRAILKVFFQLGAGGSRL
jgi:hypothetical protein